MPLTPAEVHNVAFKKPPIGKRGYDEEEVDAFLDIVEVELARLIEENNDLRARGNGAAPVSTAKGDNGAAAEAAAQVGALQQQLAGTQDENGRLQAQIAELQKTLSTGNDGAQQQVVQLQQQLSGAEQALAQARQELAAAQQAHAEAQAQAAEAQKAAQAQLAEAQQAAQAPAAPAEGSTVTEQHHFQAAQVLALAQQTADQLVAQHKSEAESILTDAQNRSQNQLAEAQAQATAHVGDAEQRAQQLDAESQARAEKTINDAEQRAATITAQFEQRKAALERRVEELRVYEREYRTRLRSYLESQLRDLDASGRTEPDADGGEQQG